MVEFPRNKSSINCDKVGHKSVDYKLLKKKKNQEANVVDNIAQDVAEINLSVVLSV